MKKSLTRVISTVLFTGMLGVASAYATPSTHVWAPSTDIQAYGVAHITSDIYVPVKKLSGVRPGTITNLGLTTGVLPYEKLGLEGGFDHIEGKLRLYFKVNIGIPEKANGDRFPALAVGGFS